MPKPLIEQANARAFVTRAFKVRCLVVLAVWGFFETVKAVGAPLVLGTQPAEIRLDMWAIRVLSLLAVGAVMAYRILQRRYPEADDTVNLGLCCVDALLVTFLIHFMGGMHSSAYGTLYVFVMLFAAGVLDRRRILLVTGFCSACYLLLFYFELQGLLPSRMGEKPVVDLPGYLIRLGCVQAFLWTFGVAAAELAGRYQSGSEVMRLGSALTGLAHELRTPLSVIASEVGAARARRTAPDWEVITGQVNLMGVLFNDLCDFGTYSAGKLQTCNLVDIVEQAAMDAYKCLDDARKDQVRLTRDYPPEEVMIQADSWNLQRAVVNIIRNAVDSRATGAQVRVTVKGLVACANLEVTDDGCGISRKDLRRIFDPFFSTKRHKGGHGLGLALTKKIIEEHGGHIRVESDGEAGTRVIVRMPRVHD